MKNKLFTALKTKYANLGFGDKAFDGVAELLSKTVADESGIDTAVASAEPWLRFMQSETDKLRTRISDLERRAPAPTPAPDPAPAPNDGRLDKLMETVTVLAESVKTLQTASSRKSLQDEAKGIFATYKVAKDRSAFVEKAWETAQMKFTETTTAQEMAEMAKAEFDSLCNLTGVNGYEPQTPQGGQADYGKGLHDLKVAMQAEGIIPADPDQKSN